MKVGIAKIKDGRSKPWQISYFVGGKRYRKHFETKNEAQQEAQKLKQQRRDSGERGMVLTPQQIAEYLSAKQAAGSASLIEVVTAWVSSSSDRPKTILSEAREAFCAEHSEDSYQYRRQLDRITRIFAEGHPGQFVDQIRTGHIDAFLENLPHGAETRMNYRRVLNTWFTWMVRQGMIEENPVARARRYRVRRDTPRFLTRYQVYRLLAKARRLDPDMFTPLALQAFFGLRTYEVCRLRDSAIQRSEKRILIGPDVAKASKGRERPRLLEGLPDKCWKMIESPLKRIGVESYIQRRTRLRRAARIPWYNSALRKAFITHAVAYFGGADRVALISGHDETSTLHTHYRGLVTKADAVRYFTAKSAERTEYGK